MKIIIHLFFVAILIFSCSNPQKVETPFVPQDILEQNDTISNKDKNDDSPIIITNKKEKYTTFERSKELSLEDLEIEPYTFRDTILSRGYHLSYRVAKDTGDLGFIQSLTLVKGNQDIKILGLTSYPMRQKSLGYIGVDFGESFVFVQSFGSGNPHYISLVEKYSGNEIRKGTWVDAHEEEQILLYAQSVDTIETLQLLDLKNSQEINIIEFDQSNCILTNYGGFRNCITIDSVSNNEIILSNEEDKIKESYLR